MKKVNRTNSLLFILLILSSFYRAQSFALDWVKQMGGSGETVLISHIGTDKLGNIYTLGTFSGTPDFNPGPGTYTLSTHGFYNCFLSKLDSSGNFLWAQPLDSIGAVDLAIGRSGNIYVLGRGPGPFFFIIVSKLNSLGNIVWIKKSGSPLYSTTVCSESSLALDSVENVYTTGTLFGSVDFDPDTSKYIVTTPEVNVQSYGYRPTTNFYLSKLDSTGKFVFVKTVTKDLGFGFPLTKGVISAKGEVVALDGESSIYKYDLNGNLLWSQDVGFFSSDLTVDRANNINLVGYFSGYIDCDPGPDTYYLGSTGGGTISSLFAIQLTNSGNFGWARRVDDWNNFYSPVLKTTTDAARNLYIAGSFKGTVNFDPSGQTVNPDSPAGSGFILRYDAYGNFNWVKEVGENSSSGINAMTMDDYGNLYTAGTFAGTVDFDPASGMDNLTSFGSNDAFIHKLGIQQLVTGIQSQSSDKKLSIFPNPTNGLVYVQVTETLDDAICKLTDISGKIVLERRNVSARTFALDLSEQPKGFYMLEISDNQTVSRIKLVKE